jgi:tetratricopeptide (TPR) repeat protein
MLETIREFALERLAESSSAEQSWRLLSEWCTSLAESAERELSGPAQKAWLDRLEYEHENFRAALSWCLNVGEADLGLRLASALFRYWYARGHLAEGADWLRRLLAVPTGTSQQARASALYVAGNLAHMLGDQQAAVALQSENRTLRQGLGDQPGLAAALTNLGNIARQQGDTTEATRYYKESLAIRRAIGDLRGIAVVLLSLAVMAHESGRLEQARALASESMDLCRAAGDDLIFTQVLLFHGQMALKAGNLAEAAARGREALQVALGLNSPFNIAESLILLADVQVINGDLHSAAVVIGAGTELLGADAPAPTKASYQTRLDDIRCRLGPDEFNRALDEAREMGLQGSIDHALGGVFEKACAPSRQVEPRGYR